jgi:predicted membrane-bound spermidine synthase
MNPQPIHKKFTGFFLTDVGINSSIIQLILYLLFFCSGCSALIYQVMWQRMFFTLFGVDLESITIIVSVFMFGLGLGGLCGGYVADVMSNRLLTLYVYIELSIALFGFISPELIKTVGHLTINCNEFVIAMVSFLLLVFPTSLMGGTFPILVTHVNKFNHHVGRSVGLLYFMNTLGGALGAYFSGFVLLYTLDVTDAVNRAAFINLAIAAIALVVFRKQK